MHKHITDAIQACGAGEVDIGSRAVAGIIVYVQVCGVNSLIASIAGLEQENGGKRMRME